MRIALVNALFPPDGIGGSERSVEFLARGLVQRGHQVFVFCQGLRDNDTTELVDGVHVLRFGSPAGYQPNVLAETDDRRQALRAGNRGAFVPFFEQLISALPNVKPDIVHLNVIGRPDKLWRGLRALDLPVVQTLRSYSFLCNQRMFKDEQPCLSWCDGCRTQFGKRRTPSRRVDALVGVSRHILKVYRDAGFFQSVRETRVIPNSYETRRHGARILGRPLRLGYLGRLHPTKGVEQFLDGVIARPCGNLLVKIAGAGNPAYVRHLRNKYGSPLIGFEGFVAAGSFLESVDVLVAPSLWHEPFGRVTMEALHHGVPVLATRRGGIPETITPNVGWLYEPGDQRQPGESLARIEQLTPERYSEMSKACLEEARRYTVEAVTGAYLDLYETVRAAKGRD